MESKEENSRAGASKEINLKIGEKQITLVKKAENNIYQYSADDAEEKPVKLNSLLSAIEFNKPSLPSIISTFTLEKIAYDIPAEQLEISGKIKSAGFVLFLKGKTNPEIKLTFTSEKEGINVGELIQQSIPPSLTRFLPAIPKNSEGGLLNLLNKGSLSELKFENNTLTGDVSLSATGEVLGIKGSIWFSTLTVEEQMVFLHIKGDESNAQSIPGFLTQQLGLSIPPNVEEYLPKMKIALTEFSFDQVEKRFYMLGVVKQGNVKEGEKGYRLQGALEVKWENGLWLNIDLNANENPVTLAGLMADLPVSLEGLKQAVPESFAKKIEAFTFYNFHLLVDSEYEEFEIGGKVNVFGEFLADITFYYSSENGIRFSAEMDAEPLSLEEIIDALGVEIDKTKLPALKVGITITQVYFDQAERQLSVSGAIETENGWADISFDIQFKDGIKFSFSYNSEEERCITVGEIITHILPQEWVGMLPAISNTPGGSFIEKLKNSGLYSLELDIDTAAEQFLFKAGGRVLDIEGELAFSVMPEGKKKLVTLNINGEETNADSIKGLIKNRLGIPMSSDVEAYLPKMKIGLTRLAFDQKGSRFNLAGIITGEQAASYKLKGDLGIKWQKGLFIELTLDANDSPVSMYNLTEALPISAADVSTILPKAFLEEMQFYHLHILLDGEAKKYTLDSTVSLFGSKIKSGINIYEKENKSFFYLHTTIDSIDINALLIKVGIAALPNEVPNFVFKDIDFSVNTETELITFKGKSAATSQLKIGETNLVLRLDINAQYNPATKLTGTFIGELDLAGVTFKSTYTIDKQHKLSFEPRKALPEAKEKGVDLRTFINDLIPGAGYPNELPDIFITNLSGSTNFTTQEFTFNGSATIEWDFPQNGNTLKASVDFSLSRTLKEENLYTKCTFNLTSKGTLDITSDVYFSNFKLDFILDGTQWKLEGDVSASLFKKVFTIAASYDTFDGAQVMKLEGKAGGDKALLEVGKLALRNAYFDLTVNKPKGKKERQVTGTVGAALNLAGTTINISASLKENLSFNTKIDTLPLSHLSKELLGIDMPAELPDITFKNIDVSITPAKKIVSFYGEVTGNWKLDAGTASVSLTKATFDFKHNEQEEITCNLTVKGQGQVTDDIKFKNIELTFGYDKATGWKLKGDIESVVYEQNFKLGASYITETKTKKKTLNFSYSKVSATPLIAVPDVGSLDITKVDFSLVKENEKSSLIFSADSKLTISNLFTVGGTLGFTHTDEADVLSFTPKDAAITIPLFDLPSGEKLNFIFEFGPIKIARETVDGKSQWAFSSSTSFSCPAFNKILPPEIKSIFPDKITTTFTAKANSITITTNKVLDVRVDIPPIKLEGNVEIPLGLTRFSLTNLSITIAKDLSFSVDFGLGLPANFNNNFGTKNGSPLVEIFNTFKIENPEKTTIRLKLAVSTKGVKVVLATSPFAFITFEEKDGKVWCYADFKECGAIRFQVPEFILDIPTRTFIFNGGFEVVRELAIPLHLLKLLLKEAKAEHIGNLLPDKLPIQEISLLDKNNKLDMSGYVKLVDDLLKIKTPDELVAALKVLEEGVNRLPDSFRKYLKITLPKSFNFDISITPENQGVSLKMGVKKGDPPIRLLMPAMGPFPGLVGIELYSFSIGEIFATNFLLLEADIRIDHFDLVTMAGSLALGTDHNLPLPSSNEIHRRFIVEDFMVLVFLGIKVYGIPVPIPIPLFYKQLGVEYYGLEGLKAQAHIGFPKPELDIVALLKTGKDIIMFVSKPDAKLDPKLLGKMDLKFHVGPTYIQLPQYLGTKVIGVKEGIELPRAYETMATLLNAIKFSSVNELIKAIPYKYRAGREVVQFGPLSANATYLLTTADEFKQGAYQKLNIPQEKTAEYMKILPVVASPNTTVAPDSEEGLVLFLQGEIGLKNFLHAEAVFGLAASGSMGFHTGFKINGSILNLLDMELAGRVSINPNNAIAAQKSNTVQPPIRPVEFNGIDTFVTLPQADMDFSAGITAELWLWMEEFKPGATILDFGNEDADTITLKAGEQEGELVLVIRQGTLPHTLAVTNILKPGAWMHLAITINNQDGCFVYKDGILLNGEALHIPLPQSVKRAHNYIGKNISANSFYKGKLTDFRLWNKVLTTETINGRKDRRLAGNEEGLTAYWPIGYGSDGKSYEIIWRNRTHVVGATWPAAEEKNKRQIDFTGLLFDGEDDYVTISNLFTDADDFTITAWVKPASISDTQLRGIIGERSSASRKPTLWLNNKGLYYELFDAGGGRYNGELPGFFTRNDKWVHVAWVKHGDKLLFYRDGKKVTTADAPVSFYKSGAEYFIGRADAVWNGVIDEVQIWERSLSAIEIKSGYQFSPTGFEPGLVGYWPFMEGLGHETLDIAQSNLSAIHGAQWVVERTMTPAGVVFNGNNSFIEVSHVAREPLPLEEFTMEAWIFPAAFPEEVEMVENVNGWRKKGGGMGWQGVQETEWKGEQGWAGGSWYSNPWREMIPAENKVLENKPKKDVYMSVVNAWEGSPSGFQAYDEKKFDDNFYWGLKGNKLHFACCIDGTNGEKSYRNATGKKTLKAGEWSHIAVTRLANKITFYINGAVEEITEVYIPNGKINTSPVTLRMGGQWRGKSESGLNGGLDELRIWNKAKSSNEIKQFMKKRLVGNEPALAAYWPFSENSLIKTLDFASRYNGILHSVQWKNTVPFDFEGIKFNGKGDYVDVGADIKINSKFTFEAWIKGERGTLFERQGGKDNKGFVSIRFNDSIQLVTAKGELITCPLKGLPVNQWFHFAASFDGNSIKVFADGAELLSHMAKDKLSVSDGLAFLGKGTDEVNPAYFKGVLDDIRVWNFARNTYHIKGQMYERLSGQEAGLLNYWPMVSGEGITIYDFAGRNNGKLVGATWKKQKHLDFTGQAFNGVDDIVRLNNPFTNPAEFTVSVWLNPAAINTGSFYGIMGADTIGDAKRKPSLWLGPNTGTLHYDSYSAAQNNAIKYSGAIENFFTAANQWVHLAWVKEGSKYIFYRNGELFAETQAPANVYADDTEYQVGRIDTGWRGLLDEVRVWSKAQSQEDIKGDLYFRLNEDEEGLVAYLPLGENEPQFSGQLVEMQKSQLKETSLQAAGFKLDGLKFNGEDDYLDLGDNVPFGTSFTIEAWVKGSRGTILQRGENPQQKGHIELCFNEFFRVVAHDGTVYDLQYNHIPANEWAHIAATYNGISMQLYINGQNVASLNAPGRMPNTTTQTVIGKRIDDAQESKFSGSVDEIRLWKKALSAEEIQANMNRSLSGTEEDLAGYWPLLEGIGYTTFDKAGRNNGKLRGPSWLQAPMVTMEGLVFDGGDDYINGGAVFSSPQKEITAELWFKTERAKGAQVLLSKERLISLAVRNGFLQFKWGENDWEGEESFAVNTGEWYHVAFAYNGRSVQLYKNGAIVFSRPEFAITFTNSSELFIGAQNGNSYYFSGEIHSVRIWNIARNMADILTDRYKYLTGDEPGLVAGWLLQKEDEKPLENIAGRSVAAWQGSELQRSATQTDSIIDKILSGENAIETASATAPFVIAGHAHLHLVGKKIFTGDVLVQDDLFAFNGSIDVFPQFSPLQVKGNVRGAIAKHRFIFAGDVQATLFNFTLAGGKVLISEKGFTLTGTLLEQSVTLSLEKESESRMVFTGSLDTPIKLGEIFQLTAGATGELAKTGPKLKIAGPDNPEFHFIGYLKVLGISQQTAISFKDNGFTAILEGSLWGRFNSKLTVRGSDLKNLGVLDFTAEFENGLHDLALAVKEYLNAVFNQAEEIINGAKNRIQSAKQQLQDQYEAQKKYWEQEAERRRKEVERIINEIQEGIRNLQRQGDQYLEEIKTFQRRIEQASAEFSNKIYYAQRDIDNAQANVNNILHDIRSTENWYNSLPNIDWPWNANKLRDWVWVGPKLGALWTAYGVATLVLQGVKEILWGIDALQKKAVEGLNYSIQGIENLKRAIDAAVNNSFEDIKRINASVPAWVYSPELVVIEVGHTVAQGALNIAGTFVDAAGELVKGIRFIADTCLNAVANFPIQITYAKFTGKLGTATDRKFSVYMDIKYLDITTGQFIPTNITMDVDFDDLPGTAVKMITKVLPSIASNAAELAAKKNNYDEEIKSLK